MSKRNREEYDRLWSMQSNKVCIVVSITISEKYRAYVPHAMTQSVLLTSLQGN